MPVGAKGDNPPELAPAITIKEINKGEIPPWKATLWAKGNTKAQTAILPKPVAASRKEYKKKSIGTNRILPRDKDIILADIISKVPLTRGILKSKVTPNNT